MRMLARLCASGPAAAVLAQAHLRVAARLCKCNAAGTVARVGACRPLRMRKNTHRRGVGGKARQSSQTATTSESAPERTGAVVAHSAARSAARACRAGQKLCNWQAQGKSDRHLQPMRPWGSP